LRLIAVLSENCNNCIIFEKKGAVKYLKKELPYIIIQFILFALYFIDWDLLDFDFPVWIDYLLLVSTFSGIAIIILGIFHLNDTLSPFHSSSKSSHLVTRGIYKYVRHPIYLGLLLAMFSFGIYWVSPLKLVITVILGFVFYNKSNLEEKLLMRLHSQYREYRDRTGRFLPKKSNKRS
jgi:protein-S-isoprenylcysteine O-methyltransferase Ste14